MPLSPTPGASLGPMPDARERERRMRAALRLAARGEWTTHPNPCVGCVIVKNGRVVGQGWHEKAGQPHAEIMALRDAQEKARGADLYVTLEPCSHYGRTPPCAKALIEAGVGRVFAGMGDPNPAVNGKGLSMLREAGIETHCGILEKDCEWINRGYVSALRRGRPWFALKWAMSLDGKIALKNGKSQWITSERSRLDAQRLRARSSAIVTGVGSILRDDSRLNVRAFDVGRQPLRVVLDSKLHAPASSFVIQDAGSPTLIVAADPGQGGAQRPAPPLPAQAQAQAGSPGGKRGAAPGSNPEPSETDGAARILDQREAALIAARPDLIVRRLKPDAQGRVDLADLAALLQQMGAQYVLCECGPNLSASLLQSGLVDELIVYVAPKILGADGVDPAALPELAELPPNAWRLAESRPIGDDLRLLCARRPDGPSEA